MDSCYLAELTGYCCKPAIFLTAAYGCVREKILIVCVCTPAGMARSVHGDFKSCDHDNGQSLVLTYSCRMRSLPTAERRSGYDPKIRPFSRSASDTYTGIIEKTGS